MEKCKVLIVDDEPLARNVVTSFLEGQPDMELCGECENGFEALKRITEVNPDLIFLDIQMPKINGFELLELLDPRPAIIFTTAFDQYAIRAFEMNAVDYLLKPFSRERFHQALDKVRETWRIHPEKHSETLVNLQTHLDKEREFLSRVIVRMGSKIHVIPVQQIQYIEAQDDYVMIHTESGNYLKDKTMKYFETHLSPDDFIRTHRGFIVYIPQIASLEPYRKDTYVARLRCGQTVSVSAEGYKRLREKL